jgi:hypothetical protein
MVHKLPEIDAGQQGGLLNWGYDLVDDDLSIGRTARGRTFHRMDMTAGKQREARYA